MALSTLTSRLFTINHRAQKVWGDSRKCKFKNIVSEFFFGLMHIRDTWRKRETRGLILPFRDLPHHFIVSFHVLSVSKLSIACLSSFLLQKIITFFFSPLLIWTILIKMNWCDYIINENCTRTHYSQLAMRKTEFDNIRKKKT